MSERIFLSSPDVTQAEEDALVRALRSGWVAPLGPEVDAFEDELAAYTGRACAVALTSGSAALHLGLLQLGAGPGTVVITSSMTFAATANAITYTGAMPVFVDSDETGNVDPALLAEAMEDQLSRGAEVAAIVPVDLIGKIADHRAIDEVAARHGIPVLVDAAESLGATRAGRRAGQDGVASIVSFNGNKIMTTSGGGALLCDDPDMADRTRYLATQARQPVVHYEHVDVGYNYRMSNLLAAVGRAQLERLPSMLERRRGWRWRYAETFQTAPGVTVFGADDGRDAPDGSDHDNFWLTSIVVDPVRRRMVGRRPARSTWRSPTSKRAPCGSRCTSSLSSTTAPPTSRASPSASSAPASRCRARLRSATTSSAGRALDPAVHQGASVSDTTRPSETLADTCVTITGGTGSFGSAMARHLLETGVRQVNILSRDEAKQDEMRRAFNDERLRFFLGDVRDNESIRPAVTGADFVFHAAALKQVPSCEFFPQQAVKTNVIGSHNVIEAAAAAGVRSLVCLSTDKAVYPVNAMGMSKALMEKTAQAYARNNPSSDMADLGDPVRQRHVLPWVGDPGVRGAAQGGRAAHRDRARHDALPHVARRIGSARRARVLPRESRRPVRQEGSGLHGRHLGAGRLRPVLRRRGRHPGDRHPARGEAARDPTESRGDDAGRGPG